MLVTIFGLVLFFLQCDQYTFFKAHSVNKSVFTDDKPCFKNTKKPLPLINSDLEVIKRCSSHLHDIEEDLLSEAVLAFEELVLRVGAGDISAD